MYIHIAPCEYVGSTNTIPCFPVHVVQMVLAQHLLETISSGTLVSPPQKKHGSRIVKICQCEDGVLPTVVKRKLIG